MQHGIHTRMSHRKSLLNLISTQNTKNLILGQEETIQPIARSSWAIRQAHDRRVEGWTQKQAYIEQTKKALLAYTTGKLPVEVNLQVSSINFKIQFNL
jgi:hypothetical protein